MKKLALSFAIVLGLGLTSFAGPNGGGVFGRGEELQRDNQNQSTTLFAPRIPNHGQNTNQPATLGSGIAVLTALGAAYLVGKRRNED